MMRDLVRELCAVMALTAFVASIFAGGTLVQSLRTDPRSGVVAEVR